MRYKLSRLVKNRRSGTRQLLPPIRERLGTISQYQAVLRKLVRDLATFTRDNIIPTYQPARLTRDADQNTFRAIRALAEILVRGASQRAAEILGLESQRHTEAFINQAKQVFGIDISAVVRQEDLTEYLQNAAARNTSLIKSLSDDTIKRVEQAVLSNQIAGNPVSVLRTQLVQEFGVMASRADLIAQDQTAKLTSDLNRIRQEQAGVEKYQWSTSHDERVRSRHRGIDGEEYAWGEPTGAENGLPPGQPIRCRCIARGIVEF